MTEEGKSLSIVQMNPLEYEWECPKCNTPNFVWHERILEVVACYVCEAEYSWELPAKSRLTNRPQSVKKVQ